jgi:hypothetical protein
MVVKILFWIFFIVQAGQFSFVIENGVIITNDYQELLGPVDNMMETGLYEKIAWSGVPYAGRLPGYSTPYLVLRTFLPRTVALPVLIFLQILLMSWATFAISRLALKRAKSKKAFYLVAAMVLFMGFWLPWEVMTYPESLGLSTFLLGVSYFYKFLRRHKMKALLLSGFFFAWMFFLRGFLVLYLLIPPAILLYVALKNRWSTNRIVTYAFTFAIPFILMESIWIGRNYISLNAFIPLQTSFVSENMHDSDYDINTVYKPSMLQLRELIACWGGDNVHFYPGSDMSFFVDPNVDPQQYQFPPYVYTEVAGHEEFVALRNLVQTSFNHELEPDTRRTADNEVLALSVKYKEAYKTQRAVDYYVRGPVNRIKNLVANNVVGNWPGPSFAASGLLYKGWKGIVLLTYLLSMIIAVVGFTISLFRKRLKVIDVLMLCCLLTLVFTFTFIFNTSEFKYFMTGSMILVVYTGLYLSQLLSLRRLNRIGSND